jgi:hypothetical protein
MSSHSFNLSYKSPEFVHFLLCSLTEQGRSLQGVVVHGRNSSMQTNICYLELQPNILACPCHVSKYAISLSLCLLLSHTHTQTHLYLYLFSSSHPPSPSLSFIVLGFKLRVLRLLSRWCTIWVMLQPFQF